MAYYFPELHESLGCMVGHDTEINRVFGLASDGVTFMRSDDDGQTWAATQNTVHQVRFPRY